MEVTKTVLIIATGAIGTSLLGWSALGLWFKRKGHYVQTHLLAINIPVGVACLMVVGA